MRIATWNLERGGRTRAAAAAQEETLRETAADIFVLTEPPTSYKTARGVVASPPRRAGRDGPESWVAIVGATVEPIAVATRLAELAVAARARLDGKTVLIYGSVLPWLAVRSQDPSLVRNGETFADVFTRVLEAQKADILRLRSEADLVVWAGDFNQSLEGPIRGCSALGRSALKHCLAELELGAWNADAAHAYPELRSIDLICGPKDHRVLAQGRIDRVRNGTGMSDHVGYWVEL